jgi:hypothetical protein
MKRREFITLFGGAAALSLLRPLAAYAQQAKAPRIGALVLTDQDGRAFGKAIREGLRELGLIEGENYALELRSADAKADRLPQLAQELTHVGRNHDETPTTARHRAASLLPHRQSLSLFVAELKLLDGGDLGRSLVRRLDRAQRLRPAAQQRQAPGAHAGGELGGRVLGGATARRHASKNRETRGTSRGRTGLQE